MGSVCSKTRFSRGPSEHTELEFLFWKVQEAPDSNPPFPETGESMKKKLPLKWKKKSLNTLGRHVLSFF